MENKGQIFVTSKGSIRNALKEVGINLQNYIIMKNLILSIVFMFCALGIFAQSTSTAFFINFTHQNKTYYLEGDIYGQGTFTLLEMGTQTATSSATANPIRSCTWAYSMSGGGAANDIIVWPTIQRTTGGPIISIDEGDFDPSSCGGGGLVIIIQDAPIGDEIMSGGAAITVEDTLELYPTLSGNVEMAGEATLIHAVAILLNQELK